MPSEVVRVSYGGPCNELTERVATTNQFQQPDRVPIDLGEIKASGIAAVAFDRVRKRLGIEGLTRVQDPRFMIADVEQDFIFRFHVDVVPLDLSTVHSLAGCDQDWIHKRLFDGTDVLMPPGTRIGEEVDGDWVLLDTDGAPTTFRMPRNGFYFDDLAFNTGGVIRPEKTVPPHQ